MTFLWGTYQKVWTDITHLWTRSKKWWRTYNKNCNNADIKGMSDTWPSQATLKGKFGTSSKNFTSHANDDAALVFWWKIRIRHCVNFWIGRRVRMSIQIETNKELKGYPSCNPFHMYIIKLSKGSPSVEKRRNNNVSLPIEIRLTKVRLQTKINNDNLMLKATDFCGRI